ncbi:MAG: hypothetical protein V4764_06140 [Burkholderia sp.]
MHGQRPAVFDGCLAVFVIEQKQFGIRIARMIFLQCRLTCGEIAPCAGGPRQFIRFAEMLAEPAGRHGQPGIGGMRGDRLPIGGKPVVVTILAAVFDDIDDTVGRAKRVARAGGSGSEGGRVDGA